MDEPQQSEPKKIQDNGCKWHEIRVWRRLRLGQDIKEKIFQNLTINVYFSMINGNRGCRYNIGIYGVLNTMKDESYIT